MYSSICSGSISPACSSTIRCWRAKNGSPVLGLNALDRRALQTVQEVSGVVRRDVLVEPSFRLDPDHRAGGAEARAADAPDQAVLLDAPRLHLGGQAVLDLLAAGRVASGGHADVDLVGESVEPGMLRLLPARSAHLASWRHRLLRGPDEVAEPTQQLDGLQPPHHLAVDDGGRRQPARAQAARREQ